MTGQTALSIGQEALDVGDMECRKCSQVFPVSHFYFQKGKYPTACKACRAEYMRQRRAAGLEDRRETDRRYRERNREARRAASRERGRRADIKEENRNRMRAKYDPDDARARYVRRTFSLSLEEYDALIAAATSCALCGTTSPGGKNGVFHLDHCHKTGAIREPLCSRCNLALGQFDDDPDRLRAAAAYLERHSRRDDEA
jgi:hypothetical protein